MLGEYDLLQLAINAGIADSDGHIIGASGSVVYGHSFPMPDEALFGWEVLFSSDGTVNVMVELEQANVRPSSEGSADTNFVVPDSITSEMFSAVTDELVHLTTYSPVPSKYGRLKLTALSGNATTTKLARAKLSVRRT